MNRRKASVALVQEPAGPRPALRWAGGKDWLVPELKRHMPPKYGRYFEPFCGGAALFFSLQPERAILSDLNAELIDCYRAIRDDAEGVIGALRWHADHYGREGASYYYHVRSNIPTAEPFGAARTIFLNKTGYNGLYRVNQDGGFNVPHGRTGNGEPPTICDADNLRACSCALQGVTLRAGDWLEALDPAHASTIYPEVGDFVYADSPYYGTFTGYTAGGFSVARQDQLAAELRALQRRGVYVMASNADTPEVRELYRGFRPIEVKRSGSMNSKISARGKVGELLILGEGCP